MRNLKLVIEFDGSHFHGSQRQSEEKEPTVQGVMEKGSELLRHQVHIAFQENRCRRACSWTGSEF